MEPFLFLQDYLYNEGEQIRLGRVTSVFWTLHYAPAPLGAALFTWLSAYLGASRVLALIGIVGTLVMLTALLTPARQRFPERRYGHTE